jgi:hypothetical protein
MGIPLKPDPLALRTMERRSLHRAAAALAMTHGQRDTQPQSILKSFWRDDDDADVILRAASSLLTTTGTFPQIQATKVLPMLAPDSASSRLLAMGANLSLDGIATIKIPYIGGAGRGKCIGTGFHRRRFIHRPASGEGKRHRIVLLLDRKIWTAGHFHHSCPPLRAMNSHDE